MADTPQLNALQQIGLGSDGPTGLEALLNYKKQQALAQLAQSQDFLGAPAAQQQAGIAGITGDPTQVAAAGNTSNLAKLNFNDPNLIQNGFKSGNSMVMDALKNYIPLQQQQASMAAINRIFPQAAGQQALPQQGAPQPTAPLEAPAAATAGDQPVNNPGNLRPVGASSGFMQFPTPQAGMAALQTDLFNKLSGKSAAMGGKTPTVRNIVSTYSPANENDTDTLVKNAASRMGVDPDAPLGIQHLTPLTSAITQQEGNGTGIAPQGAAQAAPAPGGVSVPPISPQSQGLAQLGLVESLNKADNARATAELYRNQPDVIANTAAAQEQAKAQAAASGKENEANLGMEKQINEKADSAFNTKRTLAQMSSYFGDFTPGKATALQKAVAEYKVAAGIGTDQDKQLAAATQGVDKLGAQLASNSIKEFTARGTNLDLATFLKNNPNISMTPDGAKNLIDFMNKSSDLDLQKQQEFTKWKADPANRHYPDFDAQWNQKQLANMPATLAAPLPGATPQAGQAPAAQSWQTTPGGRKYMVVP